MEDNHDHKKQRISSLSSSSSSSSSCSNKINGRHDQRNRSKIRLSSTTMSTQVGLRIVAQISSSSSSSSSSPPQDHQKNYSNNVVLKSTMRLRPNKKSSALDSCFLKTCNLCNKGLRLDKEVYMYRGDQGFCSKECRNRQIFLDEKKELEASTKKAVAAYRNSCNSRNSETRSILEDLIHSRQTFMSDNNSQHRRNNRGVFIL